MAKKEKMRWLNVHYLVLLENFLLREGFESFWLQDWGVRIEKNYPLLFDLDYLKVFAKICLQWLSYKALHKSI